MNMITQTGILFLSLLLQLHCKKYNQFRNILYNKLYPAQNTTF